MEPVASCISCHALVSVVEGVHVPPKLRRHKTAQGGRQRALPYSQRQ